MKYTRFEDVPVWQSAVDLADQIYDIVEHRCFAGQGDLRNQLQRAALSISNNTAEGFERGTTQELISFLYSARGSTGEVRLMLCFIERREQHFGSEISDFKSQISNLKSLAKSISRQLRAWADSLQNSDIKGQRNLTERDRDRFDRRRSRKAFMRQLDEIVESARARREGGFMRRLSSLKSQISSLKFGAEGVSRPFRDRTGLPQECAFPPRLDELIASSPHRTQHAAHRTTATRSEHPGEPSTGGRR